MDSGQTVGKPEIIHMSEKSVCRTSGSSAGPKLVPRSRLVGNDPREWRSLCGGLRTNRKFKKLPGAPLNLPLVEWEISSTDFPSSSAAILATPAHSQTARMSGHPGRCRICMPR